MTELGKPSGLARRNGSASFYFRKRCPTRLKRAGIPAEVWISLGTANYAEAIARMDEARIEAGRRFCAEPAAKKGAIYSRSLGPAWPTDSTRPLLKREQAMPLAQNFFAKMLADLDLEDPIAPNEAADWKRELEDRYAGLNHASEQDDLFGEQVWVLNDAGLRAEYLDAACVVLRAYLRRALVQLTAIRLARLEGDYRDRVTDALFTGVPMLLKPLVVSGSGTAKTALEPTLLDEWAIERAVSPKGVDKHRAVVRWFIERGRARNLSSLVMRSSQLSMMAQRGGQGNKGPLNPAHAATGNECTKRSTRVVRAVLRLLYRKVYHSSATTVSERRGLVGSGRS